MSRPEIPVYITAVTRNAEAAFGRFTTLAKTGVGEVTAAFGRIRAAALNLGTLGGALSLAGLVSGARQAASDIAAIGDEARRAGLSAKAFQELKYVAEQNRIGIDSLTDGIKELNLRADEFISTGGGAAAEAFQRLGFGAEDLKRKLEDPSALFTEIIGKLEKFDRAAQIRIADEIFGGTGGERFVQMIDQGEAGIRSQIKAANDLGIVLDDQLIARAAEIDRQFNVIANTVGTALKSAIVSAADSLLEFMDEFREFQNRRNSTLESRQAELGLQRLDLENKILAIQENGRLTQERKNKAIGQYRIELEKIAKEEAEIVGVLNDRLGTSNGISSRTWTPPPVPPGGFGSSSSSRGSANPYATARQFAGATEGRDSDLLRTFFRQANQNVDPKMTAWCAAFVNAALSANGLKGTGSLTARSFLDYGEATNDPRRGDIVVLSRGRGNQGHVGFFEGYDANGNVRVFGGNQSDGVNTKSFDRNSVLGFRTVPGATRGGAADGISEEISRRKELGEAYDDLIAGANEFVAAQGVEGQALGMTSEAAARLRYEQELLNEARRAGLDLSPAQVEGIRALAAEMAAAEERTHSLALSQAELQRAAEDFAAVGKDVTKGFISDLKNGVSAADAFKNALQRIADALLDRVLDALFQVGNTATGTGGGIIGNIFSSLFAGVGRNANGTDNWRGGLTWVGEKGPELVNVQPGAQIIPNHTLADIARQGRTGAPKGGGATIRGGDIIIQGDVSEKNIQMIRDAIDENNRRLAYAQENGWR